MFRHKQEKSKNRINYHLQKMFSIWMMPFPKQVSDNTKFTNVRIIINESMLLPSIRVWTFQLCGYFRLFVCIVCRIIGNLFNWLRDPCGMWYESDSQPKRNSGWSCILWCDMLIPFMGLPRGYQRSTKNHSANIICDIFTNDYLFICTKRLYFCRITISQWIFVS